ncbi:MAG: NAD(P)H-binding protein [Bacteroidales bacterium]|jgi:uncharacterized protein YbjT (DUF2867 family)|nr:NAD(P)H-binding protein [Bacteroidales bacterium]
MGSKTAIVFGATGLVGNLLLEELINCGNYKAIRIFVRQTTDVSEPSVEEIITDFSLPESFLSKIEGNDLFICTGTTIRKAGSVANVEKIDRDLPAVVAEAAHKNGVKKIAVVSSIGADTNSKNYYLRIKGEMEENILKMGFEKTVIVRPSILLGERKEIRAGEIVGKAVMKAIQPVFTGKFRKYRPIHGRDVAKAMISLLEKEAGKNIFESDELKKIARE